MSIMYFKINGISCSSCIKVITDVLYKNNNIKKVNINTKNSNAEIKYDENKINKVEIKKIIENNGYEVTEISDKPIKNKKHIEILQITGIVIVIASALLIIQNTIGFNFIPKIDQSMGYVLLFIAGLFTSLHCIAMCGGINISQSIVRSDSDKHDSKKNFFNSIFYNTGRVISYTVLGGFVGAIGSLLSFSNFTKVVINLIAGFFMIIIGLNLMGVFSFIKKFSLPIPKFITNIQNRINKSSPFFVGLLNGFMPCGPLQTMQIYALGTGNFINGALSMMFFSLGTAPLMLGLGFITAFMSKKFSIRLIKVGAMIVILLGILMIGRGINLSGVNFISLKSLKKDNNDSNISKAKKNIQEVTSIFTSGAYAPITVQKGIKVKWTIKIEESDLNGCNNKLVIPAYNITKELQPGNNYIEFTPQNTGTFVYTCWMGMIANTITVNNSDLNDAFNDNENQIPDKKNNDDSATSTINKDMYIPELINGIQTATITVNAKGFDLSIIVLQKNAKFRIKFIPEELTSCNSSLKFPKYNGILNLSKGQLETPELIATDSFGFSCWMGMLNAYVAVVDDINNINRNKILSDAGINLKNSNNNCCGNKNKLQE